MRGAWCKILLKTQPSMFGHQHKKSSSRELFWIHNRQCILLLIITYIRAVGTCSNCGWLKQILKSVWNLKHQDHSKIHVFLSRINKDTIPIICLISALVVLGKVLDKFSYHYSQLSHLPAKNVSINHYWEEFSFLLKWQTVLIWFYAILQD